MNDDFAQSVRGTPLITAPNNSLGDRSEVSFVCPVCGARSTSTNLSHMRWGSLIVQCAECSHYFASKVMTSGEVDIFATNRARADFYANLICGLDIENATDIGTPRDFFFLRRLHAYRPSLKLQAIDLYEKDRPLFITMTTDLATASGDLCTAFHVLEHVPDAAEFLNRIASQFRWFIIEVPNCDSDSNVIKSSTQPQVHFFTLESLSALCKTTECDVFVRRGLDMPRGRTVLVAARLPNTVRIPRGPLAEPAATFLSLMAKKITRVVTRGWRQPAELPTRDGDDSWQLQSLMPEHGYVNNFAHVAAYTPRGANAGDIVLPIALRDTFAFHAGTIDWHSIHARSVVDDTTIEKINATQGLIVGGGGLFLRDTNENDISGWQWPCSAEQLAKIEVPFCAFAVGYNRFREQADFNPVFSENIRVFTERACFVGLRNMGSVEAVRSYVPVELHDKVRFQPCLTTLLSRLYPHLFSHNKGSRSFVSLNCAFDRPELRYGSNKRQIIIEIAQGVAKTARHFGLGVKYYSHYSADDEMIDLVGSIASDLEIVDLSHRSPEEIIAAYGAPALAFGMRGHSQMIPFGCQTPIMSLISHDKLQWFLDDIGHPEWGVELHEPDIADHIFERASRILDAPAETTVAIEDSQTQLWNCTTDNIATFLAMVTDNFEIPQVLGQ